MAGGESSDCHMVPTRASNIFRLRVRLPSAENGPSVRCLRMSTVVAGQKCVAAYRPARSSTQAAFALGVRNCPSAKVSTHMVLLDKTGSPVPSIGTGQNLQAGYFLEAERDDIKANCVVQGGYFDVLCSVDIDWTPPASSLEEEELPNLGHDLAMMSDKQEFTDVSFDVGRETFSAHRVVLAARSPVFKAELYGPMAESKMACITIHDMEASTFRTMLHYLYHGSLPNAPKTDVSSTMTEYQHLLIAADRYGIERLKKICETKLSAGGIAIDNVVSMLELAEHHVCSKLKDRCFGFLTDGDNFKMVATSVEYLQLMQSFPGLLVEVRNMFKTPHEKPTIMEPGSQKKTRFC